jgi:hypothetical protein
MEFLKSLFNRARPKVQMEDDRVWMSRQAQDIGIARQLGTLDPCAAVLLIAHFSDTLARLEDIRASYPGTIPISATLAENLDTSVASRLELEEAAVIQLIVAERHPLLTIDQQVTLFAETLPCRSRITWHLSLEDPLLRYFAGVWFEELLHKLGLHEDDHVERAMLTRRIHAAQRQLEAKSTGNLPAETAEEWIKLNLPA